MQKQDRKAAVAAYRKRKTKAGIYALRCAATGQCWVGRAPDVETIGNRIAFALGHDANLRPSLRAAIGDHGAGAIAFEVVESVDTQDVPYEMQSWLRDRQEHWRQALAAEAV